MITKNLTPFYWGPKSTSRQPPQVEMAMCVRGVFHLRPGQPLEAITDEIDQGFMSGDTYDPEDMNKTGPLVHCNDFSDWKPNGDLLLKGTAYAPKGRDVVCDVAWGVGDWSKTLRVFGPRVFKPGLVFGGSVGDPEPFTSIPLTWENAYGGEGYPLNPVGKGFTGELLPHVEDPSAPVTKLGATRVAPASFLPLSPMWPQRWSKVGKNYGKSWEKTRAPFVSDDFDWSHYNAAPTDQQLIGRYLRGDETVWFQNLHPEHARFEVQLPALRLRGLVKTDDDVVRDVKFNLDTLYADLDAGRLYLTWRALTPIRELDQTDVKVVLIASENLSDAPLPATHYQALLEEFEDDPVGLKSKMPEGFLELAAALEAADKAELTGSPKPDFKKLAAKFPVGGLIPPWVVVAAGSLDDPLAAAPGVLASQQKPTLPGLDIKELVTRMQGAQGNPGKAASELEALAEGKPPETKGPLLQIAAGLRQAEHAKQMKADQQVNQDPALALEKAAALLPPEQGNKLKATAAKVRASLAEAKAATRPPAKPTQPAGPQGVVAKLAGAQALIAAQPQGETVPPPKLPDLNAEMKSALLPLNDVKVPEKLIDVDKLMQDQIANLDQQEAGYRKRFGDHPLMALFALGRGKILMAGRKIAASTPDTSALDGLDKATEALQAQGIDEEATAPLVGLKERLATALKSLPGVEDKPEQRDYAYMELPGEDLSGQDLSGKSFACAKLAGANLSGCTLIGCDFRKADLSGANLSGSNLSGANLNNLSGAEARFAGAVLTDARLRDADLSEADFTAANLARADLNGATIDQATLTGANLSKAQLIDVSFMKANLAQADLTEANLESARGLKANLAGATLVGACLKFADLNKTDMTGADLSGADMALGNFNLVKGVGLKLTGACVDVAKLEKCLLTNADLRGIHGTMGSLGGCDLTGADLREARLSRFDFSSAILKDTKLDGAHLERLDFRDVAADGATFTDADLAGCSATGKAAFRGCDFRRAKGYRSFWFDAELTGSDFSYASMRKAYFQGATGNQVIFFAADLKEASFRKATLSNSRFVRADLCHVDMCESKLERVQFTSANCYETKFLDAKLAECDFLETTLYRARFDRAEGAPR